MRTTLLTLSLATLLVSGCEGTRPQVSEITREQGVAIAHKELQKEPFAHEIDTNRMTVHYTEFGPKKEARVRWIIDFARRDSPEVTQGQWASGYQVVVEPDSGDVVEASAYER